MVVCGTGKYFNWFALIMQLVISLYVESALQTQKYLRCMVAGYFNPFVQNSNQTISVISSSDNLFFVLRQKLNNSLHKKQNIS